VSCFQIQQRLKGTATAAIRSGRGSRDYTRYDLTIGDQPLTHMSKQAAIQRLHSAGVSLASIKPVTQESRWVAVRRIAGEAVEDAFRREHPSRSPNALWLDFGITEGDTAWAIAQFEGRHTESMLDGLAGVAPPHTTREWCATGALPAEDTRTALQLENGSS
jgi:hypothetical protein